MMATAVLPDDDVGRAILRMEELPTGYGEGVFEGRRYGVTLSASPDGRRRWIFGEELGGPHRISGNFYQLSPTRVLLRPCEMPAETVLRFILEFDPATDGEP